MSPDTLFGDPGSAVQITAVHPHPGCLEVCALTERIPVRTPGRVGRTLKLP
jgi:hypothetical protein